MFILGLAIIFVYCMKFFFPSWSPALAVNEVFAHSTPLLFSCVHVHVCTHTYVKALLCIWLNNALKYTDSSAHKSKYIMVNGAWRLRNKKSLCFSSNIKIWAGHLLWFLSGTLSVFKSYGKYESIVIIGALIMPNLFGLSKAFCNWVVKEIGRLGRRYAMGNNKANFLWGVFLIHILYIWYLELNNGETSNCRLFRREV